MARKKSSDGDVSNGLQVNAFEKADEALKHVSGSQYDSFNNRIVQDAINGLWLPEKGKGATEAQTAQATVAAMMGIAPKDEIEGMLVSQMCAAHAAAMEGRRRAMLPEQTLTGLKQAQIGADRAHRSFVALLEALQKYRGRGDQTVRVEHVHVYQGGQAIVGNVSPKGVGGEKKAIAKSSLQTLDSALEHAARDAETLR